MSNPNAEWSEKLAELMKKTVDEQTKFFLHAFVSEFSGKFEAVLDLVEQFKKNVTRSDGQLDEQEAHIFLEKRGEAATVVEFREKMRQIDLDFNKRIGVIEYLLFFYKKTLKDLFEAKPNAHLIKMLDEAIAKYQAVFRERREREDKLAELEAKAAAGDARAKSELKSLQTQDTSKSGADEIGALAAKLKAKRALANPDEESKRIQAEAFKEEQRRVAEAKAASDAEAKRKAQESRNKLAAKAAMFGGQ